MTVTRPRPSVALPIAHFVLRVLIFLNWLSGAAIFILLTAMPTRRWIMSSLELSPGWEADRTVFALRLIAGIGLVTIPLNFVFLRGLFDIVQTVGKGDPFVAANACRLRAMAWTLLALQLMSLVIGAIARSVSTQAHPLHIDAGFSIAGWLAVLLTFLLAQVFAEGARMREDLEGTI